MMPGFLGSEASAGIKLLSLAPKQPGRSSHLGVMMLYDANLIPVAMLCASTVTALRTAATTACATDVLAPRTARQLAILGSGEQADAHLSALQLVRNFASIRIWSRTRANALALANRHAGTGSNIEVCEQVAAAVNNADVICTLTSSQTPILTGHLVPDGVHVNMVGSSSRGFAETDDELVMRARFFVDLKTSALSQAGELLGAIERGRVTEQHIAAEIGEVIAGTRPGRASPSELTAFKSLGIAAEDIALAAHIHRKAERLGLGQMVEL
jgi:ornithine cyclodeaminase/alanine dehydrogenase-like protein (mu-crystallin family)